MQTQALEKDGEKDRYSMMLKAVEILSEIEQDLRYSAKPRIILETAVIRVIDEETLSDRIDEMERKIKEFPS